MKGSRFLDKYGVYVLLLFSPVYEKYLETNI